MRGWGVKTGQLERKAIMGHWVSANRKEGDLKCDGGRSGTSVLINRKKIYCRYWTILLVRNANISKNSNIGEILSKFVDS